MQVQGKATTSLMSLQYSVLSPIAMAHAYDCCEFWRQARNTGQPQHLSNYIAAVKKNSCAEVFNTCLGHRIQL